MNGKCRHENDEEDCPVCPQERLEAMARELSTKLFALSRDGKDNICSVKSIDLKTMARTAHSIAECLKRR